MRGERTSPPSPCTGDDTLYSVGGNGADLVDCGSGIDTVKKGVDSYLGRFVGCERFVG